DFSAELQRRLDRVPVHGRLQVEAVQVVDLESGVLERVLDVTLQVGIAHDRVEVVRAAWRAERPNADAFIARAQRRLDVRQRLGFAEILGRVDQLVHERGYSTTTLHTPGVRPCSAPRGTERFDGSLPFARAQAGW